MTVVVAFAVVTVSATASGGSYEGLSAVELSDVLNQLMFAFLLQVVTED